MSLVTAELKDGTKLQFEIITNPPAGGMKKTYFGPNRDYVVQLYHNLNAAKDPQRLARLEAILTRFNPTLPESQGGARGVSQESADYFKKLFCWPTAIVVKPQLGIVAPAYSTNYFFATGSFKGQEKKGRWFSSPKLRKLLPELERGSWINYFRLCILMARAVRRLHQAGLAHSDLSSNNILIDPSRGLSVVIDIDSLVVPELFPPDVLGTRDYIAPEVLTTNTLLPPQDPRRIQPTARTDEHALAVLIYEYLLFRHPLRGRKVHNPFAPDEDEFMAMGPKALFIENPHDTSNRPSNLRFSYQILGPFLKKLFEKTFVDGLHSPDQRPSALEWERDLIKSWDLLYPCPNPACSHKWFILYDYKRATCPFCGTHPRDVPTIPVLNFLTNKHGKWMPDGRLVVYNKLSLFKWHVMDNIFPGEDAEQIKKQPQAYFAFHQGRWVLINQQLTSLTSPGGSNVQPGQAVELGNGVQFTLSQEPHGRKVEATLVYL